jgi:hypothetical protein
MAIDRLNSTAALIAALREDVVARAGGAPRGARVSQAPAQAGRGSSSPSATQLRRQLVELAQGVDLDDPGAVRHARTRFVRAILVWEFGRDLREHPEWMALTERIDRALDTGGQGGKNEMFVTVLRALQSRSSAQ